jgi:hypothetical protein
MPIALPPLPYADWEPTLTTLHLFSQIVGKVRLASTPPRNHWWNVTLYVTETGLTTGPMRVDETEFEIIFDFIQHRLIVFTPGRKHDGFKLRHGLSVAKFYKKLFRILGDLGIGVRILAKPYGMAVTTPFRDDEEHAAYNAKWVERWWAVSRWTVGVFESYASDFAGKASPAHLFWHSFDWAMARYNGKRAPQKPGANHVEAVAYSHDVIAVGFWAGDPATKAAGYYTYTAPEPGALTAEPLASGGTWVPSGSGHLGFLPYEAVQAASQPEVLLLEFLRSGYQAGAKAAGWDQAGMAAVL